MTPRQAHALGQISSADLQLEILRRAIVRTENLILLQNTALDNLRAKRNRQLAEYQRQSTINSPTINSPQQ